jgi:hypothetical protein
MKERRSIEQTSGKKRENGKAIVVVEGGRVFQAKGDNNMRKGSGRGRARDLAARYLDRHAWAQTRAGGA